MSIFNMDWFRSEAKKQKQALEIEEQELKNDILRKQLGKVPASKPYRTVKLINNVLTVVLNDGTLITKPSATVDDFVAMRNVNSEVELFKIIAGKAVLSKERQECTEKEKIQATLSNIDILSHVDDFVVKDGSVYFKGLNRSLPALLINKIADIVCNYSKNLEDDPDEGLFKDDEYIGLKRFFLWCCANPRVEVANELYGFLERNGMKITKQGFFVGLRNVVEVKDGQSKEIVYFISNAYNKVKGVWKKDAAKYEVYQTYDGYTIHPIKEGATYANEQSMGNLKDLYLDLPKMKENRFTDNWTHTFDIRIGQVVSMSLSECNWSTQDCATAGLHFAGHTAPYVLCGDTTVFTLHNPMKVVGIGSEKGRCYEYLPFMTTNVREADDIMNSGDFDFLQLDEQYAIEQLNDLENVIKKGFVTETEKYTFSLPEISTEDIRSIVSSLQEMKNEIKERVSAIK